MVGVRVPAHSYLHMLAVDLARSPDGQWWVLSDRTQAPSGSGYALENRTIVADVLPNVFRSSNVVRLAPFFRAQRDALASLASCGNPRIVLLTPGPHNETYFEHSYLARYLGFTLVEGADLTVRDRRVYLKTVDGLDQVDVILRRVDDSFCDPLELRSDSLLGVPGLVGAIVAGNVKRCKCPGQRGDRDCCDHAFSSRPFAAHDGRESEASVRCDLVVRAAIRSRLGSQSSGSGCGEAGVSVPRHGARLRSQAGAGRKRKARRATAMQSPMNMWPRNRSICPMRRSGITDSFNRAAWCCELTF